VVVVAAMLGLVLSVLTSPAGAKQGSDSRAKERAASYPIASNPVPAGAQRLHFEVGPIDVRPGQNNSQYTRVIPEPTVDGYIVGMSTNLHLADGSVPPVDVIHLHHGAWVNFSRPNTTSGGPDRFFAAGEEKTIMALPKGYGYPFKASDHWLLVYMLHNQLSTPTQVWITYDIDLIPATSPAAQTISPARPLWMDVMNPAGYPVFDVLKGSGTGGAFTFPDQAHDPYGTGPARNEWTVDHDGVLLGTAGHVHPGGLHDDLWLTRKGATAPDGHGKPGTANTVRLFKSVADYFEPAGKVSWDLAMTATPNSWRPEVKKGDVLSITSTYDSTHGSWYESMGIMVVWMADKGPGVDPFKTPVDVRGVLTHGHLAENDNHGGRPATRNYQNLLKAPSRVEPSGTVLPIADFTYAGDLSEATTVPAVVQGGSLVFRNEDNSRGIWHTVTACKLPCDRSTGIAYPLADGTHLFDSAELGTGDAPASGVTSWKTPSNLPPGTYTYFCRIHPFMRGVFRVVPKSH
jgi:plastocyanin